MSYKLEEISNPLLMGEEDDPVATLSEVLMERLKIIVRSINYITGDFINVLPDPGQLHHRDLVCAILLLFTLIH